MAFDAPAGATLDIAYLALSDAESQGSAGLLETAGGASGKISVSSESPTIVKVTEH
jgi:hypothetical protein